MYKVYIIYLFLLAIDLTSSREKVAFPGNNKLVDQIVSKYVFYYTKKKTLFFGSADFLNGKKIRVIGL